MLKLPKRQLFRATDRFSVYYGTGYLDKLLQYDTVVIESGHRKADEIRTLQANGTLVLAYVSVMEIHDAHPLFTYVKDEQYLRTARSPYSYILQEEYGNRLVDLTSENWRGHLLRHIGHLIKKDGYDGVFLDTIGDVELPNIVNGMQQVEAAATLVQQIRKWFPDAIVIQNNGLEILCRLTAPYLDAITWENPPIDVQESRQWVRAVAHRLVHLRLIHPLRVLVLFEGRRQDQRIDFLRGRAFAEEYGFTPYFSPLHYQSFH